MDSPITQEQKMSCSSPPLLPSPRKQHMQDAIHNSCSALVFYLSLPIGFLELNKNRENTVPVKHSEVAPHLFCTYVCTI